MDTDLIFFLGLLVVILAVPWIISQVSESYYPVAGGVCMCIGLVLMLIAIIISPDRYTMSAVPDLFFELVGRHRFW